jgi:hypothetical protein
MTDQGVSDPSGRLDYAALLQNQRRIDRVAQRVVELEWQNGARRW